MLKTQEEIYEGIIRDKRAGSFTPLHPSLKYLGEIYPISTIFCTIETSKGNILKTSNGARMKEGEKIEIHSITRKLFGLPIYKKNFAEYKGEEIHLDYVTIL